MVSAVYLSNLLAHQHAGKQEDITVEQDVHPQILAIPGISEKLPEWRELAETIAHEPERQGVAGSKV
jgi:hypothetical protein